jgi:hypothetical protein
MEVKLTRSGERWYSLTIERHDLPPLEFSGPGYDPLMPHDVQHMIVESELGLSRGVFGFLAAGGEAGGAHRLAPGEDRRTFARRRAKAGRRDRKMLRDGARDEGALSEAATYVCWYEWLRRSHVPERRARAAAMAETARSILSSMPDDTRATFTQDLFARVCARMDQLSARWARLAIGESFSVEWTARPAPRRR